MLNFISTYKELKESETELQNFYESIQQDHFLSPHYCIKAYELFYNADDSNKIYFIIKRIKNNIVGYIPMYINAKGVLKFIFDKHTDFLSEVGVQFDFNDFKKITQEITVNTYIKRIDLDNLPSGSKVLNYFKHFYLQGCCVYSYNNHSFIVTKGSKDLLKHLSSSNRSELKRVSKKNNQFTFKVYTFPELFPKNDIEKLRLKMISNGSREDNFLEKNALNLIEYLFNQGEIEIFSKISGDDFVSASFVLKNNADKRMVWIDLYDDIQYVNLSSYIEYVNYLDSNGMNYLSFGRGSYDYKAKNFQPNCENLYNLRYSKSKWDFFFTNYYPIKGFVKRIVKSKK